MPGVAASCREVKLSDGCALLFQPFDKGVQKLLATRIAVYLMTFLIVTVAWAAHTRYGVGLGLFLATVCIFVTGIMCTPSGFSPNQAEGQRGGQCALTAPTRGLLGV